MANFRGIHLTEEKAALYLRAAGLDAGKILPELEMKVVRGKHCMWLYRLLELEQAVFRHGGKLPDVGPFLTRWQRRRRSS